jgi:hypothetical protein
MVIESKLILRNQQIAKVMNAINESIIYFLLIDNLEFG